MYDPHDAMTCTLLSDVYFGSCDLDTQTELAVKQGVTASGVFHIYKGMERVEEVTRGECMSRAVTSG